MLSLEGIMVDVPDAAAKRRPILTIEHLSVLPGGLTVVAGPSGSGKSTLLNVISGITPISRGSVSAFGALVTELSESQRDAWRRQTVGMIFQDFNLIGELSPLDNIRLPESFGKAVRRAVDAKLLVERLGIPADRTTVSSMSRGEQQRVAIARALLFDPPIILADEPTASLDRTNGAFVIETLIEEAAKGKIIVAVSHDPELLARATRTIHLDHGRLVGGDCPG